MSHLEDYIAILNFKYNHFKAGEYDVFVGYSMTLGDNIRCDIHIPVIPVIFKYTNRPTESQRIFLKHLFEYVLRYL